MRIIFTMHDLEEKFKTAIEENRKYIAVKVLTPCGTELIVFDRRVFNKKLKYYQMTYDEFLNHKYNPNVRIINVDSADYMEIFEVI